MTNYNTVVAKKLLPKAKCKVVFIIYEVIVVPPVSVCLVRLVFGSLGRPLHWQSLLNKVSARDFSCIFEN